MVRRKELFTLEELRRAGGRLKANKTQEINGVPNEILKEVIGAYPVILLKGFNSCLQEGRFFVDWKKQKFILLRKGNKPLEDTSSYRPICPFDTRADRDCRSHPMWSRSVSAYAQHWWPQGPPRWWRAWQIRICFMQLWSGQVPLTTMLSTRSCSWHSEVWC